MKKKYEPTFKQKMIVFVVVTIIMTIFLISQQDAQNGSVLYQIVK